jgi:hypothetical protein
MNTTPFALALLLACPSFLAAQEKGLVIEHFGERGSTNRTLFASKPEGTLRLVAGGALVAGTLQKEAFLAELLESSGLDAVAVGYQDLSAQGPDRRALITSARIPFVCANVKGAGRTHVVRTIAGTRVALVGVTKVPSYLKDFQLAKGWTIDDPAASLKSLLPEIAKEADVVILLAVMDRLECSDLLKGLSGIHVALVPAAAGNDPEPLQAGTATLVQTTTLPSTVSRLTLTLEAKKVAAATNHVETVVLSNADGDRVKALFSKHQEGVDLERLLAGVTIAPPPAAVKETGPLTSLEPGKTQPVVVLRSDGSVEIRIESVQAVLALGDRKAGDGFAWLVVRSEWKNLIPLSSAGGRQLPTAYSVADAGNNLYLVANGKTLSRLEGDLSSGTGGLLEGRTILLPRLGSVRRGDLVFRIPSVGVETLALHFYDFRHKPSIFPLLTRTGETPVKPILPSAKNEILEVGIFRITRGKAPDGMAGILLDLRARSLAGVEVDGVRIGVAGDIQEAWKGLRLVSDGGRESAQENKSIPAAPRFLPEAMTGWDLLFFVPEKAVDLELRWSFPDIGLPDGRTLKPASLSIPIAGKGAAPALLCPKCGTATGANDKFCETCGTKLGR